MVRRCAVKNCTSTDLTIVSHRFPSSVKQATTWRDVLEINDIPLTALHARYVVCSLHFALSDYRNPQSNFLNTTAIPKKGLGEHTTRNGNEYYGKQTFASRSNPVKFFNNEITEQQDVKAIRVVENAEEEQDEDDETELEVIEVIGESDDETHEGIEDDVDYLPHHKIHKFDSSTKDVGQNTDCVLELSEEDEDDGKYYEEENLDFLDQEETNSVFCDDNHTENNSIDEMFLPINLKDQIIDDELEEINHESEGGSPSSLKSVTLVYEENEPDNIQNTSKTDYDEGEYANFSRKDLIEKLIETNNKNRELETKLESLQKAQADMIKSIENFKNIFNS